MAGNEQGNENLKSDPSEIGTKTSGSYNYWDYAVNPTKPEEFHTVNKTPCYRGDLTNVGDEGNRYMFQELTEGLSQYHVVEGYGQKHTLLPLPCKGLGFEVHLDSKDKMKWQTEKSKWLLFTACLVDMNRAAETENPIKTHRAHFLTAGF
jgi:hypothetical protein